MCEISLENGMGGLYSTRAQREASTYPRYNYTDHFQVRSQVLGQPTNIVDGTS